MMNTKIATLSGLIGGARRALNTSTGSKAGEGLPLYWIGRRDLPSARDFPAVLYGPEHEVTRFLMTDTGVILALCEYEKRGFTDLTGNNAYTYTPKFNKDRKTRWDVILNRLAGAFPGGYRVEIRNLAGSSKGHRLVEISVSENAISNGPSENPHRGYAASIEKIESSAHSPQYRWIEEINAGRCVA